MGVFGFLVKKGVNFVRNKAAENNQAQPAPEKKKIIQRFI